MTAPKHSAATLRKRRMLAWTWAGLAIGWAIVRAVFFGVVLGDHGLNPWIYLGVDLASAVIDAVTTPKMVLSFVDREYKRAALWGVASAVAFAMPDVYLFVGTGELPKRMIYMIVAIITVTLSLAVFSVVRKIRQTRAERLKVLIQDEVRAAEVAEPALAVPPSLNLVSDPVVDPPPVEPT